MESITKNRQSLDTLRAMVARAYGDDHVPSRTGRWVHELRHGWFNVAYRIRLRDGRHVVLKIAPARDVDVMTYERGAMATELAAIELIRARTTVPVPDVDFVDASGELGGAGWFFMPYVDAENYGVIRSALSACEQDRLDGALGRATRELNTITGEAFGPLAGPGVAGWRACFLSMVEAVLADGSRRGVDLDYARLRALFAAHADCLDEVTEPRFVEWDLWDSNVLTRDGEIVCIIDHERAFWGDPLIEAGFVATRLPSFGNPAAFLRGYGKPALTPGEHDRRRLYNLHLTLVMLIETAYRGVTGPRHLSWVRARLAEALALF
ncbi:aminoglycoside phosphotransferase [Paractinoplanes abujensis]|uniref:Aminoglycoside phosphotransferase (APT) family kinase protein n=1 Tax=Paractinoplanes abujensis TaxID=882441 RepID=A0A7W7G394_9ACTN|nr:aminoglycoside phosphotransferase family protein [Actinoplanes abujensis]MBB4693955.1 aminoglycoside phosphotransferase (APT) family kinase protein [Actinoplanes abujensis]GID21390.1 aminoglycoside phosphotransferase [Actinoplanes abujensis]